MKSDANSAVCTEYFSDAFLSDQFISFDLAILEPLRESKDHSESKDQSFCCKRAEFFELSKHVGATKGVVVLRFLQQALVRQTQSQQLHKRRT